MKLSALSILLSLIVMSTLSGQGITFGHSWEEAQAKAKKENKIIFVDGYASWCGPCKRLAKKIFPLEEVGQYFNQHFINLKLDMEKEEARSFRKTHPVHAYPTLFFISPDGKTIHKIRGAPRTADALLAQARLAVKKFDPSQDLEKKYEAGSRDKPFLISYASALRKAGKSTGKLTHEYVKNYPDLSTDEDMRFLFEASGECDSRAFELMVKNKKRVIALLGEDAFTQRVKEACDKTVEKAINYKVENLLDEAKKNIKKHDPEEAEKFGIEADMRYYSALKDANKYLKAAKKYAKKYTRNNLHKQYLTSQNIFRTFPMNQKVIKYAYQLLDDAASKGGRPEYLALKAKLLSAMHRDTEALKAAQQALYLAGEYGENTRNLQSLIKAIQYRIDKPK